tara:strand:+ start:793 stop:1626 length:834 start_codon:yes stop_codon:yes gene_type:complete
MKIALVQLNSSSEWKKNIKNFEHYLNLSEDCELLVFPENSLVNVKSKERYTHALSLESTAIESCQKLAQKYSKHIVIGAFPEKIPSSMLTYQTLICINEHGKIVETYRKIHLFKLQSDLLSVNEEKWIDYGPLTPKVFRIHDWTFGLSICYDLRFPELFRLLVNLGAEALLVPSAFTHVTGQAHWHPLLRARAIENLSYVFGVNQIGTSKSGYLQFGHTLAVDPWGKILSELDRNEGMIKLTLCKEELTRARQSLPALEHQRFCINYDCTQPKHPIQ